jgi:hypothetical protein
LAVAWSVIALDHAVIGIHEASKLILNTLAAIR